MRCCCYIVMYWIKKWTAKRDREVLIFQHPGSKGQCCPKQILTSLKKGQGRLISHATSLENRISSNASDVAATHRVRCYIAAMYSLFTHGYQAAIRSHATASPRVSPA